MRFFDWVIAIDVAATVALVALVLALSFGSDSARQARSQIAGVVRAVTGRLPRSESGYVHVPTLSDAFRSPRPNLQRPSYPLGSTTSGNQPADVA